MTRFQAVFPISGEDLRALPVKDLEIASTFYRDALGFSVISADPTAVTLGRDEVRIGLVPRPDHDPATAGSCYFSVEDVEALHDELKGRGREPGAFRIDEYEGERFRVFFLREDDDGYCFCFGQKVS
ncbi:MAG: VOC family protein [Isosphaeraceae bacterium]